MPCMPRLDVHPSVIDDAAVVKDRALRPAGGAGGVEDLRGAPGSTRAAVSRCPLRRTRPSRRAGSPRAVRAVPPSTAASVAASEAAILGDEEDAIRSRVTEHMGQFLRAASRVDGDERDPGKPGGEFEQHPFGDVVGPYRDTVARLESRAQRRAARRPPRAARRRSTAAGGPGRGRRRSARADRRAFGGRAQHGADGHAGHGHTPPMRCRPRREEMPARRLSEFVFLTGALAD